MSTAWTTILALTVLTAAARSAGPVLLGGRALPALATNLIQLLAPAILAALIVVGTFTAADGALEIDARAAGLGAAAVVLAVSRKALLGAAVTAAVVAALVRALA